MATRRIEGMKCQHCVKAATKVLENLGATEVEINLDTGEARYQGSPETEALRKALAEKGFTLVD